MKKNIIEEQSINDNNYQKLKELFPHAVSIDEDGKYVIDKEKLQMSLDPSKAEIKEDGYGLNWVGKKEAYHSAFSKNYKVLKPLKDDSKKWDETENVLIKGDNLDALKILRHNYFEAIKMIYIDPPYNTKNDGFVYNDNFTSSTEQTLEELGYDKEYIDYIENIQGAKTHSGWLSFMYPRLLLARDLLKDDGVIFISIDDNEVAQLRLLCDEVFGEGNFVASVIWNRKRGRDNSARWFSKSHEYLLVYAKEKELFETNFLELEENTKKAYTNPDNDKRGIYRMLATWARGTQGGVKYDFTDKNGNYFTERLWLFSKDNLIKMDNEDKLIIKGDNIYRKLFLFENKGKIPETIWEHTSNAANASDEIKTLFGNIVFDTSKPIPYVQEILKIATKENDLILDFFAGSGTTAHAVMDLNKEDGGNRKYICVQWAEETPEKSEARKAGYETIFDITKERIKRAGDKIVAGDLTTQDLDVGFRTFEVVEDTKQKVYQKSLEEMSQEDLLSFMSKPTIENNEEILYNLFVAEALPLSVKHEELIKDKLYLASNVAFILGDITSDELVDALTSHKECEYITVYSPNISNDKFTLEIESNISKLGIKPDKLRFRG